MIQVERKLLGLTVGSEGFGLHCPPPASPSLAWRQCGRADPLRGPFDRTVKHLLCDSTRSLTVDTTASLEDPGQLTSLAVGIVGDARADDGELRIERDLSEAPRTRKDTRIRAEVLSWLIWKHQRRQVLRMSRSSSLASSRTSTSDENIFDQAWREERLIAVEVGSDRITLVMRPIGVDMRQVVRGIVIAYYPDYYPVRNPDSLVIGARKRLDIPWLRARFSTGGIHFDRDDLHRGPTQIIKTIDTATGEQTLSLRLSNGRCNIWMEESPRRLRRRLIV